MDYRSMKGMNQSLLKKILISPRAFKVAQDKQEDDSNKMHFLFGSLVDDMLLSPKEVDDKYFKMEEVKLSEKLVQLVQYIHDIYECTDEWSEEKLHSAILKACLVYDYQSRWGDDTKIKNIQKSGEAYFNALSQAKGRRIVPNAEWNKAVIAVASLKADPVIGRFFRETKECTIIKRKIVTFILKGIKFKGELDKVYIDHVEKLIYPIDYKTTGLPIEAFMSQFWKLRYDFQAATYTYGLQHDPEIKEYLDKGYKLLSFRYIVAEADSISKPMIFRVPSDVIKIGFQGGVRKSGHKLEGLVQALDRYIAHSTSDKWDHPLEYYNNQFIDIEV